MRQDGQSSLEIIDCVLAIFLFEITRATKSCIASKDSFDFKILNFMSTLKLSKEVSEVERRQAIEEDSAEDEDTDDPLSELIENMKLDEKKTASYCQNCRIVTKENPNFKTVYKTLI
jgi:hypothetical protein